MPAGVTNKTADDRFEFGRNWRRFLDLIDQRRIAAAKESLERMLGAGNLAGKSFLDIGSGSGLFSLAARRLGARVCSFDNDAESVACALALAQQYAPHDPDWSIAQGSVLDEPHMRALGRFDVVYAWGVLHHTGAMYRAIENATIPVSDGGLLCIAIYNDQGIISKYWLAIKYLYNRARLLRPLLILLHMPYPLGARLVIRAFTGRLRHERGMSYWYDLIDWLGGYPFEVARPEEIIDFLARRGFTISASNAVRGNRGGCNEFLFQRGRGAQSP